MLIAIPWIAAVALASQALGADAPSRSAQPAARPVADGKGQGGGTAPARPSDSDLVTLNFVNAEIEGVVKAVSEITGKNFLLDPRVKGAVNIVSARPMPRALVYDVFLSALRVQGFAAIEERGIIKIVPEGEAKLQSGPTFGPGDRPRALGDQIQTQVFALRYESAAQIVPILRPLIAPNNTISAYPSNNTLVITDYASNLQRIERIIDSIDQPSGTDPIVIPLRHASALDVVQTVNRLFGEGGPASAAPAAGAAGAADASQRITIVADPRSNSLLASSDNPSRLARLRSLVAILDSPTSAGGNIHVVHLKNAEAVKVAETLRAIYHGESTQRQGSAAPAPQPVMGAQGQPAGASPATSALSQSGLNQASAPTSTSGIIQADPATNSIIITAPDAIYKNLRAALDKLDVRRAQVYVEALIAEISADKATEFGIQWQDVSALGSTDSSARAFGNTNFGGRGQNIIGLSTDPSTAGRGLNIGVVRGRVTLPGVGEVFNIGFLVRALETDSNTNILSTPTLLTLDNEEARIVVGQNVPFITGQYALTGAATTPSPFQTIERRDVGLTLRVKPQISEGGTVRLQIYQEVSSVVETLVAPSAGPTTNKRAVESTVLVDDGQIVVIGGLIQDSVRDGVEKVPLLGDIPVIGQLFRYNTRSRAKVNLMVFLRPVVIRDARGADSISGDRYDYILGEQRKAKPAPTAVLPDVGTPELPPR